MGAVCSSNCGKDCPNNVSVGEIVDNESVFFRAEERMNRMATRDLEQIWNQVDNNGDGLLDRKETQTLVKVLAAKGVVISAEVIQNMDADKNGKVSKREFLAGIEKECL